MCPRFDSWWHHERKSDFGFSLFFVFVCVERLAVQTTFVVHFEIVADVCVQAPTIRPIPKAYGTAMLRLSGNRHRNTH